MSYTRLEPGPVALYAQLASILKEKIKSGIWPFAFEIPTLEELAMEYSVARVTVRQAIQILVTENLLSSQRGRRTYVIYRPADPDPLPLFTSVDVMNSARPNYGIEILSRDEVSAEFLGKVFRGKAAGAYMRIRKVDYESGAPYAASLHYIQTSIYGKFPAGAEGVSKIARLVRDHGGRRIRNCMERITVAATGYEESRLLQCPLNAPAGCVHRVFCDSNDHILYYALLLFRNDRFGIERGITNMVLR